MESENLLQEVRSFVSANKTPGSNVTILERSKSAIILMRSLPCARAAVLEQICDIFQEAVYKHAVETDRKDLLGSAEIPDIDPEVFNVIQSIHDTLLEFVNNNPEAWAPIITKWSIFLLGQLSAKYAERQRGTTTKSNATLNEKLQMWMSCPATQMLMEISAQCFSKLIDSNPEVCVNCLLDAAVKHSPHFDWVVAYIGSYFYKAIINHLLQCALNEFHNNAPGDQENSGLFVTAIRILDYLALQYPEEVKNSILTMFQDSVTKVSQPCLMPFFIHLGTHAPSVLNVVAIPFLDQLSPDVMVKLYFQLCEWGDIQGNNTTSLLSSVVGLIISLKKGTYKAFQFLLAISLNIQSSGVIEPEASRILNDIQKYSTILLEQVLVQLQRLVWKKHQATISPEGSSAVSGNKEPSHDIPFLNEIKQRFKDISNELLKADGKKLSWYLKLSSLVSIYSGPGPSVEILNNILTIRGTSHTLSLFVEVEKELQSFFPRILHQALEKRLKNIVIKSSPDILTEVQITLENLQKLMELEKTVGKDYGGLSISRCLKRHSTLLVSFLAYPSRPIASATLDLLLATSFPFVTLTVNDKMNIVRTCLTLFFKLLHEYNFASSSKKKICDAAQDGAGECELCYEYLEMLRKHQLLITMLCQDEACQLLIIRHLMEGAFHQENKWLFNKQGRGKEVEATSNDEDSLFKKNLNPGISSRLPLNTASVFYTGVIGKSLQKVPDEEISQATSLTNSQFFLQTMHNVCFSGRPPRADAMDTTESGVIQGTNVKTFSTLALLLRDVLVLDGSFDCNVWPDEEIVKCSTERDIKISKQFDDSEILWHLLFLTAEVPHVLLNCLSVIHGLFSSVVKFWEQNREQRTSDSPAHLFASIQIMSVLRKAMWLPRPLCLIGEIFHIISPNEVHRLLLTTWEFLKENPPTVNTRITTELTDGHHKDVVKSIFLGNMAELGHLYATFFPVKKT